MARLLVAGLLVAAAATSPLIAQAVAPQPMVMGMAKTTTRAEVQARIATQFARHDANRDGVLAGQELAARGKMGGKRQAAQGGTMQDDGMDHAGMDHGAMPRGAMSGERRTEGPMRDPAAAFDRLDADRNGAISRDEFARGREVRIEKRVVMNGNGNGAMERSGMRGMPRGGKGGGMMGAAMLRRADTNRDGRVTLAEATAGALANFDRLDANRDGRLTPEERNAGRVQARQMRRAS